MTPSPAKRDELLPSPQLDDLTFQEILDQVRPRIARLCPEWTDHNLSDPGITLLELFAHLVEMMLFRLNQVPEKMYIKFLELLGIRLEPAQPACAELTFYLSIPLLGAISPSPSSSTTLQPSGAGAAPQRPGPLELRIPEGTEVATPRDDQPSPLIFRLREPIRLSGPLLCSAHTARADGVIVEHDHMADDRGQAPWITIFGADPKPGDTLHLGFARSISRSLLKLSVECDPQTSRHLNPEAPPLEWRVVGPKDSQRCELLRDNTRGLTTTGEVLLSIPPLPPRLRRDEARWWLALRYVHRPDSIYGSSPRIRIREIAVVGGTGFATHAETVGEEMLGLSDGTPGQEWRLRRAPILAREEGETLMVHLPDGRTEAWEERSDLADSEPEDPHFTLDSQTGLVQVGIVVPTPDGRMLQFGRIPPRGARLTFGRYRHGGGVRGNLAAGTLKVLKSAIPFVARVENRRPAVGGRDGETLEHARLRALRILRARDRAVTAADYESLATEVSGVARARCTGAGSAEQPSLQDVDGQVIWVRILPELPAGEEERAYLERLSDERVAELLERVAIWLRERSVIGVKVGTRRPALPRVTLKTQIHLRRADLRPEARTELQETLHRSLSDWLSPYRGGEDGRGWPFGHELNSAELTRLVERHPEVSYGEISFHTAERPGRDSGILAFDPLQPRRVCLHQWALPLVTVEVLLS